MKIKTPLFKIIVLMLIHAFLLLDVAWAWTNVSRETDCLGAALQINNELFNNSVRLQYKQLYASLQYINYVNEMWAKYPNGRLIGNDYAIDKQACVEHPEIAVLWFMVYLSYQLWKHRDLTVEDYREKFKATYVRKYSGDSSMLSQAMDYVASLKIILEADSKRFLVSDKLGVRIVIDKDVDQLLQQGKMTKIKEITASGYLSDIPKEIISIVHQFNSFQDFEPWFNNVVQTATMGAEFTNEALSFFETLALLFGLESKPDKGLSDSKGSIVKNMQLNLVDKEKIWEFFYNPKRFFERDEFEEIEARMYVLFDRIKQEKDDFIVHSRIKQYKSLMLKMNRIIAQLDKKSKEQLSVSETIEHIRKHKETIATDSVKYIEDFIGFNFIIDDTDMDAEERSKKLTEYSEQVILLLKEYPELKLTILRKESRVKGFEAVNLFVQGWLPHKELGDLPIKIQFRFKRALQQESPMYYMYKKYGLWELPPWAENINFDKIASFRKLQKILFNNFKQYSSNSLPVTPFSIFDHVKNPSRFILYLNLQNLSFTSKIPSYNPFPVDVLNAIEMSI